MPAPTRPREEVARLGQEIYERDLRSRMEAAHRGKVLAIDVDSGNHAIADTASVAAKRLRAQHPNACVWLMRVGYRTLRHFGGSSLRRTGWRARPHPGRRVASRHRLAGSLGGR